MRVKVSCSRKQQELLMGFELMPNRIKSNIYESYVV